MKPSLLNHNNIRAKISNNDLNIESLLASKIQQQQRRKQQRGYTKNYLVFINIVMSKYRNLYKRNLGLPGNFKIFELGFRSKI